MAKKLKQTKPAPLSMSRRFRKIATAQPSTLALSIIIMATTIFLFGGGIYTITAENILPSAYVQGRFYFIYPDLSYQFIADTIISTMLYAMGFIGILSIYQSTKYAYKPRQAYMMLIIGVTLLFLAYWFLESAIKIKLGR